jgi:hypothetical protein
MSSFLTANRGWVIAGVLLLLGMACGQEESEVKVTISPQQESVQSGVATLQAMGNKTQVVVKVTPGQSGDDPQPAHIHFGKCEPNLGTVRYPLTDVAGGESLTLVDATLESLRDGNGTINIHESYPSIKKYTACGDIPGK